MPFRADDMQSARGEHLFPVCLTNRFCFRERGLEFFCLRRQCVNLHLLLPQHFHGEALRVTAKEDIHPASCHIRCDSDGTGHPCLRDDIRFPRVLLRIQHLMFNVAAFRAEHFAQFFGVLNRNCADEDGAALLVLFNNILQHSVVFRRLGFVNLVCVIFPDHRFVGRNDGDFKFIDMREFIRFCRRSACHSRQFFIQAEIILVGNFRAGLAFLHDAHALLRFNRLMEPLAEPPANLLSAGEFINEEDFAVLDEVVHIAFVELMRCEGLIDVMDEREVGMLIEVVQSEAALHLFNAFVRKRRTAARLPLLVDLEMGIFAEHGDNGVDLLVEFRWFSGGFGDDERRARLVNEDAIHFVKDAIDMPALHLRVKGGSLVIPEIIKPEFAVNAVGDVRLVAEHFLFVRHLAQGEPDSEPEEVVNFPHPLGITSGKIVVHGGEMHTSPVQRVQVNRQCGGEGFSFAGAHFGDLAPVERDAAHELDIVVPLFQRPHRRFANDSVGIR